ncbi:MAG TPA: L-lactate permease, partial [Anaerolineaceae bacterium]|nr:L-lactate permease [Anaerolineaceae bacterium]
MALTWYNWLLSFLPILTVILLMIVFKWSGRRAATASWLVAALIALVAFGADWQLLAWSQAKAFLLAMDILWTVWGAITLYHLANEAGTIQLIGDLVPMWMKDRTLQILMLTIVLTAFMQGMGGFGVPVAIVAPILLSMGFNAVDSVVMACLGHAWAVTFGTIGAAFNALVAVSGYPAQTLAPDSAILLGLAIFPCALLILYISQKWQGVRHGMPAIILLTLGMGLTQYLMATAGMGNVAVFGASILGALILLLIRSLPLYHPKLADTPLLPKTRIASRLVFVSVSPYMILVTLGFLAVTVPPLRNLLDSWKVSFAFPELRTAAGWVVPAGQGKVWFPLSHSGTLTFVVVLLGGLIYATNGLLSKSSPCRIIQKSLLTAIEPSLGILAMVGLSQIMSHTGMTSLLARGLGAAFNRYLFPAIVPFIGMLGAFLTGSNNNSNVLFAPLHMEAASILKLSVPLMLAA